MVPSQFLCPDMLSKVFEHLDPGRLPEPDEFPVIIAERKVRKHTLAQSARVCSAFTAPALDVLWRRVDAFDHLLCLFPTYSPTECEFTGSIAETEWQRFQVYASRVRAVHGDFGKAPNSIQQEQVWMVMHQMSQGSPLLSKLESLIVGPSLGALLSLLCSTVHTLNILIPNPLMLDGRISSTLLADVLRPHLTHILDLKLHEYNLSAYGPRHNLGFCQSIDICVLTHLERLELCHTVAATQSAIQALMTFPNLYHLSLNFFIPTDDQTSIGPSKLAPGLFKLRELRLNASYRDIALFLETTDPAGLEELVITRELHGYHEDFLCQQEVYAQIPRHIRSLHQIFVDVEARARPRSPGDMYSPEGLLPENVLPASLQTLPDLREVVVSCQYISGAFMDGSLLALCSAWPSLETSEYRDSTDMRQWSGPGTPTFDTLLAFTRAHPHLAKLTLSTLSASGIPDIGAFDTGGPLQDWPAHRALRFFRLHCSPAPHTPMLLLAIAMDRAFPRLCLGDPRLGVDATYRDDASVVFVDLLTVLMLAVQTARKISDGENVSTVLSMQEMIRSASPRRRVEHGPY